MATWEDVTRLALALPDAEEGATYGGNRAWTVRSKMPDADLDLLEEVVTEAWLACAPKRLAQRFLDERDA